MTVADMGEFGLIARVAARLRRPAGCLVGPGDDAAVLAAPDGRVVASTDVLVEGRHFRRDWAGAVDIGRRAAAANLADIAAMGATGTALLVGLCVPADLDARWVEELADGLAAEADLVGAGVVGGDMSGGPTLTIAVTALGALAGRDPVLRSGAGPGDVLAVAGRLGHAAAGYALLSRGHRGPEPLIEAYRRPAVPYPAGPAAAGLGATSMIDVSDGLVRDLGHLAAASGVLIDVEPRSFDIPDAMRAAAGVLDADPYSWILAGGDDHALAATFPAAVVLPAPWRVVGAVSRGGGVTVGGVPYRGPAGWEHFR